MIQAADAGIGIVGKVRRLILWFLCKVFSKRSQWPIPSNTLSSCFFIVPLLIHQYLQDILRYFGFRYNHLNHYSWNVFEVILLRVKVNQKIVYF
jgi:hypothetical protein